MGYILFSAKDKVSIDACRTWNGTIEYSYNNKEWYEWNGDTINNNVIYMRGINNSMISNYIAWFVEGTNVKCQGNIENLLDYKSVINNVHPKIKNGCFGCMFDGCKTLIETVP